MLHHISNLIFNLVALKEVPGQLCFFSFPALTWYPAKISTFILPVIEIEQIIMKLTTLRDKTVALSKFPTTAPSSQPNDFTKIEKMIGNWNSILTTYRSQTDSSVNSAFSKEMSLFDKVATEFSKFQETQSDFRVSGQISNYFFVGLKVLFMALEFFIIC